MQIAVPHHTSRAEARVTVETKMAIMLSQFGGRVDELQHEWIGDRLEFKGKARGFQLQGTVEITDTEVIVDAKLPLLALPFEPRIREALKREAEMMFPPPTAMFASDFPSGGLPSGG